MKFSAFNLKEELVNNLTKLGYNEPTKVQEVVIPKALKGENIRQKAKIISGKVRNIKVQKKRACRESSDTHAVLLK